MNLSRFSPPCFVLRTIGLSLGVLALGCGRPATEEDCREILRKSAELELVARLDNDRAAVDKELEAIENAMRPAMMERCVGKRISDGALKCVRSAKTADEIISVCLR